MNEERMNTSYNYINEFKKSFEIIQNMPKSIYHYTSCDAIFNIIKNNSLWLTDRRYMNDMMDSEYISKRFFDSLPKLQETNLLKPLSPEYVFSTTLEENSFFHYSQYGNYRIEFDREELFAFISDCITTLDTADRLANPFYSDEVIYDESLVNKIVKYVSKEYFENLKQDLETPFSDFKDFRKWRDIFLHFSAIIKQQGFSTEKEYRFVLTTSSTNKKKMRYSYNDIVPYIEFSSPSLKKLPMKTIKVCQLESAINIDSLKEHLSSNGFHNVNVMYSDLQIRKNK